MATFSNPDLFPNRNMLHVDYIANIFIHHRPNQNTRAPFIRGGGAGGGGGGGGGGTYNRDHKVN